MMPAARKRAMTRPLLPVAPPASGSDSIYRLAETKPKPAQPAINSEIRVL
jgi:hypothetical protein